MILGSTGVFVCIVAFFAEPSFPTPDKLLVFATFVAMVFGQAREMLKRFVPFVVLLLCYESFRGLVPRLNHHVNYVFMPAADKVLFMGKLPTKTLQNLLWNGHIMWYDFVFYGAYLLHFVLPFALAAVVWKKRESHYWRVITAYVTVSFLGFLTFLIFPAAPPWLASDKGLIEPIVRISTNVFLALGIQNFPSLYDKISPNPVAAMPSLHTAYAILFALFVTTLFKNRWRWLSWLYPVVIMVGTVYQGEHYVVDVIAGIVYAAVCYAGAPYILKLIIKFEKIVKRKYFGDKQKRAKLEVL